MNLRSLTLSLSLAMILGACTTTKKNEISPEERARRINAQHTELQQQQQQEVHPEAPYPGAQQGDDVTANKPPVEETARPMAVDEDGNYYYGAAPQHPRTNTPPGVETPKSVDENQNYVYDNHPKTPSFSNRKGVEVPVEIDPSGEFRYVQPIPTVDRSASFRIGAMTPPQITNPLNHVNFATIYGTAPIPTVLFSYEIPWTKKIGRIGIRFGSGLTVSSGNGRFVNQTLYPNLVADERFTFIAFPNQATIVYKFQYSDTQPFVLFVEGGVGAFTFMELRDDGLPPKFGVSGVAVGAGGINFLLDKYDPHGMRQLANDYGIGHVWLTLEFRQNLGLSPDYNFTSSTADLGVIVDF